MNPTFTLLPGFFQQYGIVQYSDGTFGAVNVHTYELKRPEGDLLPWQIKTNSLIQIQPTFDLAVSAFTCYYGGLNVMGQDVFNPAVNPFQSQFGINSNGINSNFPDGEPSSFDEEYLG